jgi:hypothetical protein
MPENTENIVLEHLRHIRESVDRIEQRLDDLTTRVGHRLEARIKERLDLADA